MWFLQFLKRLVTSVRSYTRNLTRLFGLVKVLWPFQLVCNTQNLLTFCSVKRETASYSVILETTFSYVLIHSATPCLVDLLKGSLWWYAIELCRRVSFSYLWLSLHNPLLAAVYFYIVVISCIPFRWPFVCDLCSFASFMFASFSSVMCVILRFVLRVHIVLSCVHSSALTCAPCNSFMCTWIISVLLHISSPSCFTYACVPYLFLYLHLSLQLYNFNLVWSVLYAVYPSRLHLIFFSFIFSSTDNIFHIKFFFLYSRCSSSTFVPHVFMN